MWSDMWTLSSFFSRFLKTDFNLFFILNCINILLSYLWHDNRCNMLWILIIYSLSYASSKFFCNSNICNCTITVVSQHANHSPHIVLAFFFIFKKSEQIEGKSKKWGNAAPLKYAQALLKWYSLTKIDLNDKLFFFTLIMDRL